MWVLEPYYTKEYMHFTFTCFVSQVNMFVTTIPAGVMTPILICFIGMKHDNII